MVGLNSLDELNTKKVYRKLPDPRTARRATILRELRTPERLTTEQIEALVAELGELQADLEKNPEEKE